MFSPESHSVDPEAIERERAVHRARIERAGQPSQDDSLDDSARVRALVDALLAGAEFEFMAGQAEAASTYLVWAIELCEEELAVAPDNVVPRRQFVDAQQTFSELHQARGRLDEAADCRREAISQLQALAEIDSSDVEHGLAAISLSIELATLLRTQRKLQEAGLVLADALEHAGNLAKRFPNNPRCEEQLEKCREQVEQLADELRPAAKAGQSRPGRREKQLTGGAIVALLVIGALKFAIRGGVNLGGNAPAPRNPVFPKEVFDQFASTIEYINDSPNACTVRLVGHEHGRRRSYVKQLPAGPGSEVRESIEVFQLEQIEVESAGQSSTTDVSFPLPKAGLARLKIDAALAVTPVVLSKEYRPRGVIAKPTDEGVRRIRRLKAGR